MLYCREDRARKHPAERKTTQTCDGCSQSKHSRLKRRGCLSIKWAMLAGMGVFSIRNFQLTQGPERDSGPKTYKAHLSVSPPGFPARPHRDILRPNNKWPLGMLSEPDRNSVRPSKNEIEANLMTVSDGSARKHRPREFPAPRVRVERS